MLTRMLHGKLSLLLRTLIPQLLPDGVEAPARPQGSGRVGRSEADTSSLDSYLVEYTKDQR